MEKNSGVFFMSHSVYVPFDFFSKQTTQGKPVNCCSISINSDLLPWFTFHAEIAFLAGDM